MVRPSVKNSCHKIFWDSPQTELFYSDNQFEDVQHRPDCIRQVLIIDLVDAVEVSEIHVSNMIQSHYVLRLSV